MDERGVIKRNYLIDYKCLDASGKVLKEGTVRAKRKLSEFEALAGAEEFFKKTVKGCVKMTGNARLEHNDFGDMLNDFKDLFGVK